MQLPPRSEWAVVGEITKEDKELHLKLCRPQLAGGKLKVTTVQFEKKTAQAWLACKGCQEKASSLGKEHSCIAYIWKVPNEQTSGTMLSYFHEHLIPAVRLRGGGMMI